MVLQDNMCSNVHIFPDVSDRRKSTEALALADLAALTTPLRCPEKKPISHVN